MAEPKFQITDVERDYTLSREIGQRVAERIPTGVRSALIRCRSCGNAWRAFAGERELLPDLVGIGITCRMCEAEDHVSYEQLGFAPR